MFESDDLLPERVLAGDAAGPALLVDRIHRPLARASHAPLLQTATAYLETGGSLEATARALFVHPNTVRYRLGRIADVTGYDLTHRARPRPCASPWPWVAWPRHAAAARRASTPTARRHPAAIA